MYVPGSGIGVHCLRRNETLHTVDVPDASFICLQRPGASISAQASRAGLDDIRLLTSRQLTSTFQESVGSRLAGAHLFFMRTFSRCSSSSGFPRESRVVLLVGVGKQGCMCQV